MIKLKNLLKESYVWERKFGEKLPTLADVQRKKLAEGKWGIKGKYLTKDGGTTSIPGAYDNDACLCPDDPSAGWPGDANSANLILISVIWFSNSSNFLYPSAISL